MTTLLILRSVLVIANPFAHRRTLGHNSARGHALELTHRLYGHHLAHGLTHSEYAVRWIDVLSSGAIVFNVNLVASIVFGA